jgi:UDP-glucose 4-epimerase
MELFDVRHLIFSSSCSVYGNSDELPVTESTPFQKAESPYARTKQMGEQMIEDFAKVHPNHNSICFDILIPQEHIAPLS